MDGVFLVWDSQSNPKTFVLSMSHGQKIKHFQIIPVEDDGEMFHTLDETYKIYGSNPVGGVLLTQ